MYTEVLGVLHHLLPGGLLTIYDPLLVNSGQSTRTLFSPRADYSQNRRHPNKVTFLQGEGVVGFS